LLMRIHAVRGDSADVSELLAALPPDEHPGWTPSMRMLRRMVELAIVEPASGTDASWDALLAEATRSAFFGDEHIEVPFMAALTALRQGRIAYARAQLDRCLELAAGRAR